MKNIKMKLKLILFSTLLALLVIIDLSIVIYYFVNIIKLGSFSKINEWISSEGADYKGSTFSKGVLLISIAFVQIPIIRGILNRIKENKIENNS